VLETHFDRRHVDPNPTTIEQQLDHQSI
jgi:hypothetical protein